MLDEIAGIE